jgi:surface polysaccharide O-acyltransferase-like enzyme
LYRRNYTVVQVLAEVKKSNKLNIRIQLVRGMAAAAVVCIHSTTPYFAGVWIRPFLNFAVGTFLFLSGYLTSARIVSTTAFYRGRLSRVLVPYTIWSLLYTLVYNNWGSFVKNYLTGNACDIYYFIIVYIQMVLLTPLLARLIKTGYRWLGFMPSVLFVVIKYYLLFNGRNLPELINLNFFWGWLAFYYLGLCVRNGAIDVKKIQLRIWCPMWILMMALQMIEGDYWLKSGNYGMAVSQLKITALLSTLILCCIFTFWFDRKEPVPENPLTSGLKLMGDVSFGIYLTHVMMLYFLRNTLFTYIPDELPLNWLLTTAICFGVLYLAGRLTGARFAAWLGLR